MRTQDFEADGGCGGGSISVQHPQRVPLGGLPVIWCSGAPARPCQLIPEGVEVFRFCWPGCTVNQNYQKRRLAAVSLYMKNLN